MSNYRRSHTQGGVYFFTVVTHHRFPFFIDVTNIKIFRKICKEVCIEQPFEEIACVILRDHIHCLWKLPENDCDYSKRWGVIKSVLQNIYAVKDMLMKYGKNVFGNMK